MHATYSVLLAPQSAPRDVCINPWSGWGLERLCPLEFQCLAPALASVPQPYFCHVITSNRKCAPIGDTWIENEGTVHRVNGNPWLFCLALLLCKGEQWFCREIAMRNCTRLVSGSYLTAFIEFVIGYLAFDKIA